MPHPYPVAVYLIFVFVARKFYLWNKNSKTISIRHLGYELQDKQNSVVWKTLLSDTAIVVTEAWSCYCSDEVQDMGVWGEKHFGPK
jgi:hypothetical protein